MRVFKDAHIQSLGVMFNSMMEGQHHFILGLLFLSSLAIATSADDPSNENVLDSPLKVLALQLFKDTSNNGLFSKVLSAFPGANQIQNLPTERLSRMYRDYTDKQFEALDVELAKRDTPIYRALKVKAQQVKTSWNSAVGDFEVSGNVKTFEERFVQTGSSLVSMQKLVIRVINSSIDKNAQATSRQRKTRSQNAGIQYFQTYWKLFEKFLIAGNAPNPSTRSEDTLDDSLSSTVSQLYILLNELKQTGDLSDPETREKLDSIRRLVRRVRQIQQLNQIGSTPNMYLNTDNVSPYSYEAVLRMVTLLGAGNTGSTGGGTLIQQMSKTFRTWVNLFQNGSILQIVTSPAFGDTYTRRYERSSISRMIQLLRLMEQRNRTQIDANGMGDNLQTIIANQNKQQEVINQILAMLNNKTSTGGGGGHHHPSRPNGDPTMSTTAPFPMYPPNIGDMLDNEWNASHGSTRPPTSSGSGSSHGHGHGQGQGQGQGHGHGHGHGSTRPSNNNGNQGSSHHDVLKQLRDQRKNLNDLLMELQQPYGMSTSSPSMDPNQGMNPPWRPSGGSRPSYQPSTSDVSNAQQAMVGIMKNLTPMINALGQMGLVSMPRIDASKIEMLDILNSVSSRELETDDDSSKEMQRVFKLGKKLVKVVDGIINEAEINTF